jgi:hypothetical protein
MEANESSAAGIAERDARSRADCTPLREEQVEHVAMLAN